MEQRYEIFLSYSHYDSAIAETLRSRFESVGLSCFMAEKDIPAAQEWEKRIHDILIEAQYIILLITPRSKDSAWIMLESGAAWILNKRVVPALMFVSAGELSLPINKFQSRSVETAQQIEKLVEELSKPTTEKPVFVSSNIPKLNEYRLLLDMPNLDVKGYDFHNVADISIFSAAKMKFEIARSKPDLVESPFFLEVSGLMISAWNGLPGGLTKYFIEQIDCNGICKMMKGYVNEERSAIASTVLFFFDGKKAHPGIVGEVEGSIAVEPRGDAGFVWDRIFIPKGSGKTFAELGQDIKNQLSPRKMVCSQFLDLLRRTDSI